MAPETLAELLAPFDAQTFLDAIWGREFLHVPGSRGRFSVLLPWPVLNRALREHRLDSPRIRVIRAGESIAPRAFLSYQNSRRRSGQPIPRLRSADLTRELRDGATLVLDAVDELHEPIGTLAEALERVFAVHIQVNAYAGWRTSHGFDLHWDDHDVLILQIAGRKRWKVYGMTRKYPLGRDIAANLDPPETPLWEGLLEDGDLLYIPRGWWHVAMPLDEPTLHLTVGVNNPTGADFLSWYVERLRSNEDVRRDLPRFGGASDRESTADRLHDALVKEWRPDLLREYFAELDGKSEPRARFSLPWSATPGVLPPGDCEVKWNSPRPVGIEAGAEPGVIQIACNGRRWRFAEASRPLLAMLIEGRACSLAELHRKASNGLDEDTVRAFVGELVSNGLAVVVGGD